MLFPNALVQAVRKPICTSDLTSLNFLLQFPKSVPISRLQATCLSPAALIELGDTAAIRKDKQTGTKPTLWQREIGNGMLGKKEELLDNVNSLGRWSRMWNKLLREWILRLKFLLVYSNQFINSFWSQELNVSGYFFPMQVTDCVF